MPPSKRGYRKQTFIRQPFTYENLETSFVLRFNGTFHRYPGPRRWRRGFRKGLHARERGQAQGRGERQVVTISDADLETHEEIGGARLRMQSRQWLAGKHNATYADKGQGVQVNVGVAVALPEAERAKLLERWAEAQQALAVNEPSTPKALPR